MIIELSLSGVAFGFFRTRFINMQSLESSASVNCLDPVCTPVGVSGAFLRRQISSGSCFIAFGLVFDHFGRMLKPSHCWGRVVPFAKINDHEHSFMLYTGDEELPERSDSFPTSRLLVVATPQDFVLDLN